MRRGHGEPGAGTKKLAARWCGTAYDSPGYSEFFCLVPACTFQARSRKEEFSSVRSARESGWIDT